MVLNFVFYIALLRTGGRWKIIPLITHICEDPVLLVPRSSTKDISDTSRGGHHCTF